MARAGLDRNALAVALVLAALVAAIYAPTARFGFVGFDDNRYVTGNPHVATGLTAANALWAFTTTWASNWHPLTWLSHMLDVSLFGLDAGPQHVVNAILHALDAILLFLFLRTATASAARSALVAALFAVHPAHVESVAWIAERKDVLSTFFGLIALILYVGYARRPGWARGLGVVAAFGASLLAKPMLVTLPVLALLLDIWPLDRLAPGPGLLARWTPLVREKLPLFALAAASAAVTIYAQARGGATSTVAALPLASRLGAAALAAVSYLRILVWPTHLSVFYPHPAMTPSGLPLLRVAASAVLLVALTWIAARERGRRPYLLVGWLWYLVALLPVIGLVQVGLQGMADRYTYLPSIGVFVAVVWAVPGGLLASRRARTASAAAVAAVILAFGVAARAQVETWRDDFTLFEHATRAVPGAWLAWKNLGVEQFRRGEIDAAARSFREAIRGRPDDPDAWLDLASCDGARGNHAAAERDFRNVLRLSPDDPDAWFGVGIACALQGKTACADEALAALRRVDRTKADELAVRVRGITGRS